MKNPLILDFDGTLIDSHRRCYELFKELVPEFENNFLDYCDLKKKGTSNLEILNNHTDFSQKDNEKFTQVWLNKIEELDRLYLDTLFPGVEEWLEDMSEHYSLVLCTARQSIINTQIQLENLGISAFIDELLVTEQRKSKKDLIKQNIPLASEKTWIIGDSPDDINTGKSLKIQTCAVLTGFRDRATLEKYSPNLVIPTVCDFSIY